MKWLEFSVAAFSLLCLASTAAGGEPRTVGLADLPEEVEALVDEAFSSPVDTWDETAGMWKANGGDSSRATIVNASGLLLRGAEGDVARAERAIRSVLALQYDAPGKPWHGTYKINKSDPDLPPDGDVVEWRD